MEEQVEKLQKATDDAESQMKKNKQLLDDSKLRLDTARDLLKQLDPEGATKNSGFRHENSRTNGSPCKSKRRL